MKNNYRIEHFVGDLVTVVTFTLFMLFLNYSYFKPLVFFFVLIGVFYIALMVGFGSEVLINKLKGHKWNGQ